MTPQDELAQLQSAMTAKTDELVAVRQQLTEAEANATKARVPEQTPLDQALGQLATMSPAELRRDRRAKFLRMGRL